METDIVQADFSLGRSVYGNIAKHLQGKDIGILGKFYPCSIDMPLIKSIFLSLFTVTCQQLLLFICHIYFMYFEYS